MKTLTALMATAALAAAPATGRAVVADGFTFAAGGDLIGPYHTLKGVDDAAFFNGVAPLFQTADAGFANQEGSVFDLKTFGGWPAAENGGGYPLSPAAVASDLKALGINMVSKANNHATDWGTEGLVASMNTLRRADVVYSGSGFDPSEARGPHYLQTARGRVALVDCASTFLPMAPAGRAVDRRGLLSKPRPGLSPLHVQEVHFVPAAEFEALRRSPGAEPVGGDVRIGDQQYRASNRAGSTWVMDPTDEAAILSAVREARSHADYVVFSIHAHETGGDPDSPVPADFEPTLFHAVLDAGADVVIRNGPHVLNGVELYRGKPIFYSLGSLFFDFQGKRSYNVPGGPTLTFPDSWYETAVPVLSYRKGRLDQIRLHPLVIESSANPTGGAPHPAPPAAAERILERLQTMSAPYGVQITIEDGVGVIRGAS